VSDTPALAQLLQRRSIRHGEFVLASGARSSYYIDCRPSTMSGEGQALIGRLGLLAIRARGWAPRSVGGLTMGADAVVVIEDVITSGGSALQAIEAVTAEGGRVLGVLAVVDREQGGRGKLEAAGHDVIALITASELGLGV
jgi:orotate phosphoribosyltransferase